MFDAVLGNDSDPKEQDQFEAYFTSWYEDQCNVRSETLSRMTRKKLLSIISHVKNLNTREATRLEFLNISQTPMTDDEIDDGITLAARLWSASCIDGLRPPFSTGNSIEWKKGTLSDTLNQYFRPKSTEKGKLPKSFNAETLDRIAGIKVRCKQHLRGMFPSPPDSWVEAMS